MEIYNYARKRGKFAKLYKALAYYWEATDIRSLLDKIGIDYSSEHSDNKLRKDLIEFLIMDSLFCLSKMITLISTQTNSTLYTNSFIAQLYYNMYLWNTIKQGLYQVYRAVETETSDYHEYHESLKLQAMRCNNENKLTEDALDILFTSYQKIVSYLQGLDGISTKPAQKFIDKLRKSIGDDIFNLLDNTYLIESALTFYRKSKEMNHGGNAYKQMISYMNLLDDDLNNDTSQFYLAIERFKLNNGLIEKRVNKLKTIVHKSSIYKPDNYIQDMLN